MKNELNIQTGHRDFSMPIYNYKNILPASAVPVMRKLETQADLAEIIVLTSYPPRECGIANYSQDLIRSLKKTFDHSFNIQVCALENPDDEYIYPKDVKYVLNTADTHSYKNMVRLINENDKAGIVLIQHEFGLFADHDLFKRFIHQLKKPLVFVFHTVLPQPDEILRKKVYDMADIAKRIIVMTHNSKTILIKDYSVAEDKIEVIEHGTHLVPHADKQQLKEKHGFNDRKILSTFGLLSSGKGIETTINALPQIVQSHPEVLFLIIGKTHPSVIRHEGEQYRQKLQNRVAELGLQKNVLFINKYLALEDLLEYLQLTDIYIFSSTDPHQAVSGTFSYAMSAGCAVVSTPIPHAMEVLQDGAGEVVEFNNPEQLADTVNELLSDEKKRSDMVSNALHRMFSTAWENSAIAHAVTFKQISTYKMQLHYKLPAVSMAHLKKMTTQHGILQFCKLNTPDPAFGYTLDDNARALIATCMHYEFSHDSTDAELIGIYMRFIYKCWQQDGYFLNYVNEEMEFTEQNASSNLADANGRAVWALGYVCSLKGTLPDDIVNEAAELMKKVLPRISSLYSTRAMAFLIKGLYLYNTTHHSSVVTPLIEMFAGRMLRMYLHECGQNWNWYESYLTYANSVLPEAMLCAYCETGDPEFLKTAKCSFDFLLSVIFRQDVIKVISNKGWLHKGNKNTASGEQPIDIAYTIMALDRFYTVTGDDAYLKKMEIAFSWFLGNNHLHQIIYNPCTGGCYDGLEEDHVNLNQGAESSVSYLMSRFVMQKYKKDMLYTVPVLQPKPDQYQ